MDAIKAVPPAGGCSVDVICIPATAKPTESAGVIGRSPNNVYTSVPDTAATTCPPMTFLGCEKGNVGAPNNKTAVAPLDATSIVASDPDM